MNHNEPLPDNVIPEGVFSRRQFFQLAGGAVAAGALPAAIGTEAARAGRALFDAAAIGGSLNIFTWQGYDLTGPLKSWRTQNHIHQKVKYINNQFDVAAILRGPGGKQYDTSSANQA